MSALRAADVFVRGTQQPLHRMVLCLWRSLLRKASEHVHAPRREDGHLLFTLPLAPLVATLVGVLLMIAMFLILFVIALLLLFLGPLRRPYLRHARFTVPATIGASVGLGLGIYVAAKAGLTPPASILLPLAMAIGLAIGMGGSCKSWCDRVLGKKE